MAEQAVCLRHLAGMPPAPLYIFGAVQFPTKASITVTISGKLLWLEIHLSASVIMGAHQVYYKRKQLDNQFRLPKSFTGSLID